MLRAVRRREGLSQRELAQRSGVALSTLAAVEAGRRSPSLAALTAVLAVGGLELAADLPPAEPGEPVVRYLRLSLVRRLMHLLDVRGNPLVPGATGPWRELYALAACGVVVLHGEAAVGMWLPRAAPLREVQACLRPTGEVPRPDTPSLSVLPACAAHVLAPVAIRLGHRTVGVDPPDQLALGRTCAADRAMLRGVAALLHRELPRDEAGRRTSAHRDPDHEAERRHVAHTRRYGQRPLPNPDDTRSWRLDDSAGLRAWLRRFGYPD